ncbi:cytoplasmic tyrosine-protein kinase BMX-like isoform X2 [Hemibagrus wyckioides]|uniref:cytoplasmic tyrosine-protein kinase BMX-like isoform X2 n=1 Tax=Hemibagrus wyckioides TaxID=337641 RepID=UPI00266CEC15|nr:cytoplasmic tyrosine-protein kinase BMX-like isoform X2 [Hemibagrus wyckioides]
MSEVKIIKEGVLLKMSQQKKKIFPRNYKERLFILTSQTLIYYEQEKGNKRRKKGSILTDRIYWVEKVEPEKNAPVERKFPFQIAYDESILYMFAKDDTDRMDWLEAMMQVIQGNDKLSAKYHKGFWVDGVFLCCGQAVRNAPGCCDWHKESLKLRASSRNITLPPVPSAKLRERTHLPPIPEDEGNACVEVVALYDYTAKKPGELSVVKGIRYVSLEKMSGDWWKIRDMTGSEGLVPSNYIEEVNTDDREEKQETSRMSKKKKASTLKSHLSCSVEDDIENYPWYVGNMSRVKTEQLLREKGKEGSFVVRDSSQKGVYTVSLFSRALDEVNGTVRHYLINVNADGLYYLAENHLFESIPQMIEYHQHNGAGLLTRLRLPARETSPTPQTAQGMWELSRKDVRVVKELGSGQFGVVQLGVWKGEHQVAIKMVKEGCMSSDEFIEEAQIMMKLRHPKLVRLYGVCTECFPIYIVTEFMSNGCLLEYLRQHGKELQPQRLLSMCLDVCEAMAYLEDQQFIHRDLAARNCLVDEDLSVKVSDFGMARYVLDDQYTSSVGTKFPVKWSAPEVLNYTRFSSKSDVWAFGVLMWEVYSLGKQPYEHYDNTRVTERVMQGHRLYRPQLATDQIYQVMKSCWHEETFLSGGVSLLHTVVNGKHSYEVGKVLTSKPSDFGRKGDKLLKIDDVETQCLPPKMFARMLSSGSPILTMHRASTDDDKEKKCPVSGDMRPYHKEDISLYFSLDMVQETCLNEEDKNPQVPEEFEWERREKKGDFLTDEEMLLVSMTNTSVAIVQSRGCSEQNPCSSCGGKGCTLNDFVVASQQSTISSVT